MGSTLKKLSKWEHPEEQGVLWVVVVVGELVLRRET